MLSMIEAGRKPPVSPFPSYPSEILTVVAPARRRPSPFGSLVFANKGCESQLSREATGPAPMVAMMKHANWKPNSPMCRIYKIPIEWQSPLVAHEELEMQLLLLDDGFQHRDWPAIWISCLLDATNPFGYEYPLPRGLLRESPRSLRRADVVLLTRCDQVPPQQLADIRSRIQPLLLELAWVETEHAPIRLRNASAASNRSIISSNANASSSAGSESNGIS